MHFGPQLRTRSQTGKGTNECALAHGHAQLFAIDVGEGMDDRTRFDAAVGQDTVGANLHALPQFNAAFKNAVDVDLHILGADQFAAHIETRWVDDAHTLSHQGLGAAALVDAFELSQLRGAVDARHLRGIGNDMGDHGHAVGHGKLHHIGQIKLLLRIVVVQLGQPGFEQARRHGHDAAVDLADAALLVAGVFLLDDGLHLASCVAHDAAVTRGIGKLDGEQRQLFAAAGCNQGLQRIGLRERHIAREHHHCRLIGQMGRSLLHRVASAELGHLAGKLQTG